MSPLVSNSIRNLTILVAIAALLSSGCCLTTTCGVGGCAATPCGGGACDSFGGAMMTPTCGAPDCTSCGVVEPGCGAPAGVGLLGCAQRSGCLGLGCFGKIFSIAGYGCSTPIYGNNGCGEAYYHDWINEPPCADPCDGCGNWTGIASGGVCGSCSGATAMDPTCGMADPTCGMADPVCGAPADPVCGSPRG